MEVIIPFFLPYGLLFVWTLALLWANHRLITKITGISQKNNEVLESKLLEIKNKLEENQRLMTPKGKEFYYE
tara:strand:+ start:903 stop:1118 length:216 start_codon:yes stop_codon:yes gene_type:complete